MALRSQGSLKLEMLSLARTSKYVDNTIVLSNNKTEETAKTERTHQIRFFSDFGQMHIKMFQKAERVRFTCF